MKHAVGDLEGGLLDYAVAVLVFGRDQLISVDGSHVVQAGGKARWLIPTSGAPSTAVQLQHHRTPLFTPSRSWAIAGPIIESEHIDLTWVPAPEPDMGDPDTWDASVMAGSHGCSRPVKSAEGATPLIAAMRAYVKAKLGDEIDLP